MLMFQSFGDIPPAKLTAGTPELVIWVDMFFLFLPVPRHLQVPSDIFLVEKYQKVVILLF